MFNAFFFVSFTSQFKIDKGKYFRNVVQSFTYFNLKNYAKLGKPVNKDR